ncbi:MAG: DUF1273 family protein [Oscillospiraceae bacterium]|nr:DUF1273 family protein [Oscillospiraceae bacterium]
MNRETTCCFTGPRSPRLPMNGNEYTAEIMELKEKLRAAVLSAYDDGFRFFMSGMAEGFDIFAAEAVLDLKEDYEDAVLVAVLPYSKAPNNHSAKTKKRMEEILSCSDFIYSITENHFTGCELIRNKYMVDNSSRIIGYYNGLSSGTAHCWNYALEQGLETVNLYESI